jgi:hypothetical protein
MSSNKIVLYCKSFSRDLNRVKILAETVQRYNVDKIPFYVSVPQKDTGIFMSEIPGAIVVSDESIVGSGEQSWQSQQIVKANFWKLGVTENYLCLDSDAYFIRPFTTGDFIVPGTNVCYTVMHEQKDLFSWTVNKKAQLGFDPMESFRADRQRIMDIFGREGRVYDFGPAPVLWNCDVWQAFSEEYLAANNMTFMDCIKHTPSEFTWYGEYLLASKKMEIWPVEPLFKVFHYNGQVHDAKRLGYTEADYAKLYLGIIMQSNDGSIPVKYS